MPRHWGDGARVKGRQRGGQGWRDRWMEERKSRGKARESRIAGTRNSKRATLVHRNKDKSSEKRCEAQCLSIRLDAASCLSFHLLLLAARVRPFD